jgi:hypothetical protein
MEDGSMMWIILIVYALLLLAAIGLTLRWATNTKRNPLLWGGLAIFMLLIFWDLIPTLVVHKHYCDTQAGFWVYKTPEQWKAENLGVMETLKDSLSPTRLGLEKPTAEKTWVNQRFYMDVKRIEVSHALMIEQKMFFDAKNGELIAKSVNFWRGKLFGSFNTLDELRQSLVLGWGNRECGEVGKSPTEKFSLYVYQFWKSGQNK